MRLIIDNKLKFNDDVALLHMKAVRKITALSRLTAHKGTEPLRSLGTNVWNLIPQEIKESESLDIFYSKIKKWTASSSPCTLCKIYVKDLGFKNVTLIIKFYQNYFLKRFMN